MALTRSSWKLVIATAVLLTVLQPQESCGLVTPVHRPLHRYEVSINSAKPHRPSPTQLARVRIFRSRAKSPYYFVQRPLQSNRLELEEPCLVGENVVEECNDGLDSYPSNEAGIYYTQDGSNKSQPKRIRDSTNIQGTETKWSAATNLGKCICGAGSFALPHVFLKEGVLGGTLAMTACALLATYTMQSLNRSRTLAASTFSPSTSANGTGENSATNSATPMSYVALTELTLGKPAAKLVFYLTLAASLGVCSTYIAFIGQTLASLSSDEISQNIVFSIAPNIPETSWEIGTAFTVLPLSLVRNYGIFAFTSALGVVAVLGGILVTLAYGILVDPGGGLMESISAVSELRLWPESLEDAFGGSFGTVAYLFCVNFLTFPIINSMKDPQKDYSSAVSWAVSVVWIINIIFAIVCLGFYGDQMQDLVLQNLNNGPYLSALKILLCVDLLFTFPVVFSSGRQILENAILKEEASEMLENGNNAQPKRRKDSSGLVLSRAAITTGAVGACFGLSQVGGFGEVANLVGGVAQGTLAFIIPPAIDITMSRRNDGKFDSNEAFQWLVGLFGLAVVSSVSYFTLIGNTTP